MTLTIVTPANAGVQGHRGFGYPLRVFTGTSFAGMTKGIFMVMTRGGGLHPPSPPSAARQGESKGRGRLGMSQQEVQGQPDKLLGVVVVG